MKQILFSILTIVSFVSLRDCSNDDTGPLFRIRNERASTANVVIHTSEGHTINLNDIEPGQTTVYQSASEGTIVATAVIKNETVIPTAAFFDAKKDTRSTIVILAGNTPSIRFENW